MHLELRESYISSFLYLLDLEFFPPLIAGSPTWYRTAAEQLDLDFTALRKKIRRDVDIDDRDADFAMMDLEKE